MRYALLLLLAGRAWGASYFLTVAGLGGEADYDKRFESLAQDLHKLAAAAGSSTVLSGAKATRAAVQAELARLAREAKANDQLVVTLIGHGTYDGAAYKFTVPGPDISAADLGAWLDAVAARQLIVNTTSSSGAMLDPLKKANRVVITATRSGNEKNATVFARYWVEGLRENTADSDKNEALSALELFRYADQKTARFYESNKRLATEHALIEDTGAGEGVRNPGPENRKGLLAGQFAVLKTGAAAQVYADPEKRKLADRKTEIEAQIDQLKYEKATLPQEQYRQKMQALLLELAQVQEALEK
jgi:hypothetical protein